MSEINPHAQKLLEDIYVSAKRNRRPLAKRDARRLFERGWYGFAGYSGKAVDHFRRSLRRTFQEIPGICEQQHNIPLRQARGMRNFLVHDYDGVDWGTVWVAVQEGVPQLIASIEPFLAQKP